MTDGNIVAAKKALNLAVGKLTDQRPGLHNTHTVWAPSLYHQLVSELAGTQGDTRTPAKSLPPVHLDAVQLRKDIDDQTYRWVQTLGTTPQRLRMLADRQWRPQDTEVVTAMAELIEHWCSKIMGLLDPQPTKFISAACPSCGKETVKRKDSGGDWVRQPALKIETMGCTCQACRAFWAPDRYLFLCRLLGFDMPTGVLE